MRSLALIYESGIVYVFVTGVADGHINVIELFPLLENFALVTELHGLRKGIDERITRICDVIRTVYYY